MNIHSNNQGPIFYTVHEAAELFRVNAVTLYRAIRDDGFPAVRIRKRYVIPAVAVERIIEAVVESGGMIHPAEAIERQRTATQVRRQAGGDQR